MCILAFISHFHPRIPLILISNRDELLERLTYPLGIDASTGLLWAVDGVAGGSWLGIEPNTGRLAIVTNCHRAPSAPLLCAQTGAGGGSQDSSWRGAAPMSHIVEHTKVLPTRGGAGRTLLCYPETSRGDIIKNFLMEGTQPPSVRQPPPINLRDKMPYYAGYNLVTFGSLFGKPQSPTARDSDASFTALYSTNRFAAESAQAMERGKVHCLQNSFIDNWAEPKCVRLRELFAEVLADTIGPLCADNAAVDVEHVASALADRCLCATPNFDITSMSTVPSGTRGSSSVSSAALDELMHASDPRLGFTEAELQAIFGVGPPFDDGGAADRAVAFQRNIFTRHYGGYGTRVQSVVMVVQDPAGGYVTHFCQRDTAAEAKGPHGQWNRYEVSAATGAVAKFGESASTEADGAVELEEEDIAFAH